MGGILGILLLVVVAYVVFKVLQGALGVFIAVIFGAIAGYGASRMMGGDGMGLLGNIVLGLVGGVVGDILLGVVGLSFAGNIWILGPILAGVLGGIVIIFLARALGVKNFGR